jgi:uncharacterized protein YkwD
MRIFLTIIFCVCLSPVCLGQGAVELLVLEKVNELRDSLELERLEWDAVLSRAGSEQGYYMAKRNELTHFQKTFSKETPAERVAQLGGNRTYIGENVGYVMAADNNDVPYGAEIIASGLFDGWLNSPPHYKNMIHPDFTKMGLGHSKSQKGRLYSAQLFSSNEIVLPKEFVNSDVSWGVRPAEFTCKDEVTTYQTMFFANNIQTVGNSIYFFFHDLNFFQQVISDENDGLAIDIVLREQLPCDKENQFHISVVHDGEMQRPIYRNDIYRFNVSNNPKKVRVKIGEVPAHLANYQWQANVVVINDNKLCDYSIPSEVPSSIFPLLELLPYYDLNDQVDSSYSPLAKSVQIHDSMHVEMMFQSRAKNHHSMNGGEFARMLSWGPYIDQLDVACFASVDGATWFNYNLLESRKEEVLNLLILNNFDLTRVRLETKENWPLMKEQIEKHSLIILKDKSDAQIKRLLRGDNSRFTDSLLYAQRITHMRAIVDTTIEIDSYGDLLFAKAYDSTLTIDFLPWNKILRENYILARAEIEQSLIDSLHGDPRLKTNLLGAASINYACSNLDSTLVQEFIDSVNVDDSKQVFNYAHFLTKYWFSKYAYSYETIGVATSIPPEELRKLVLKIDTNEIGQDDMVRLQINILLAGIHYYIAFNDWSYVESYFIEIAELVKQGEFSAQEAYELALFCNHFYKFEIAVEILRPFHLDRLLSEEGIFALAQTATLIRDKLPADQYHDYMETAKRANHSRYCSWLDRSFQIQRDEFIKRDFCAECQ